MKRLTVFLYAILAGVCIGLGGTVFLACENRVIGAIFFSVGLFTICTNGFHLYTGKVLYLFDNGPDYLLDLPVIWLGNLTGTWLTAFAVRLTHVAPAYVEKAQSLADARLGDSLFGLFVLAVLCNLLIFIAVDGYKNNPHELGKYLALILGVVVFILCGFEHSIADMFYFSMAGVIWQPRTLLAVLVITLGNSAGGLLFPLCRRFVQKNT